MISNDLTFLYINFFLILKKLIIDFSLTFEINGSLSQVIKKGNNEKKYFEGAFYVNFILIDLRRYFYNSKLRGALFLLLCYIVLNY